MGIRNTPRDPPCAARGQPAPTRSDTAAVPVLVHGTRKIWSDSNCNRPQRSRASSFRKCDTLPVSAYRGQFKFFAISLCEDTDERRGQADRQRACSRCSHLSWEAPNPLPGAGDTRMTWRQSRLDRRGAGSWRRAAFVRRERGSTPRSHPARLRLCLLVLPLTPLERSPRTRAHPNCITVA